MRLAVCTCDTAIAVQKMIVVMEIRISTKWEHKNGRHNISSPYGHLYLHECLTFNSTNVQLFFNYCGF